MNKEWDFRIYKERFYIDGKWAPFLCGEIHYFRVPRQYWGEVLDRLKESGCNAVAYYVPWFVHEYEEGKFDFRGEICHENDLHAWIHMTMERGLLAYFRPGPYVYAETADLGIPKWFTEKYPDARVKRYRNGVYEETCFANSAAHNHPDFLHAVERWYEAVCAEIRKYQAPAGNIVMFQLCNEIPGDDHDDENPVTLGIGSPDGLWPSYLRETYENLEHLNEAYHADFKNWEFIEPYMLRVADAGRYAQEHLRYYYETYFPVYFRRLYEIARGNGIHVQLTHNAYNPRAVSLHYQNKQQNPWLLVGTDCYYSLNGRLGMKDASYYCEFGAGYLKQFLHNTPWVIEQESGYWQDYPVVYGPELYIWNIWTMACGYQGMNMYMFAGGINRPGMGFYGTEHNWQAPVDFRGIPGENYEYICRSISDIRKYQNVFLEETQHDIVLGIKHSPGLIWKPVAKAGNEAYFALKEAGFTPLICDFESMTAAKLAEYSALWVVSDEYMDGKVQMNLEEYVRNGGRLILNGRIPDRTEEGEPCMILAEALGMRVYRTPFQDECQQRIVLEEKEYFIGKNIQKFESVSMRTLAVDKDGKAAVLAGKLGAGEVLVLPFALEVNFIGLSEAVKNLLGGMNIIPLMEYAARLRVIPKKNGEYIILNLHPVEVREEIKCRTGGKECIHKAVLAPHSFQIFSFDTTEI